MVPGRRHAETAPGRRHRAAGLAVLVTIAALAAWMPGAAAAALSPLALSCTGCHRPAPATGVFVALDTLPAASIDQSLRRFRDQPDAAAIMSRFVRTLSDDDIRRLAAELSTPTPAAAR